MSYALETIRVIRDWVEQGFPGSVIPYQMFDFADDSAGFGVAYGSGVSLIFVDATNAEDWEWSVSVYGGLAVDVPEVIPSLRWVNAQNHAVTSKYYIAEHRDGGQCAVISDNSIAGVHFEAAILRNSGLGSYLRGILQGAIQWAAEDAVALAGMFGGHPFAANEDGLNLLFGAASAG